MPATWDEVQQNPDFMKLNPDQKFQAKVQYWHDVVGQNQDFQSMPQEDKIAAGNQFFAQEKQDSDKYTGSNPFPPIARGIYKGAQNLNNAIGMGALRFMGATPDEAQSTLSTVNQLNQNTPINQAASQLKPSQPGSPASFLENTAQGLTETAPVMASAPLIGFPAAMGISGVGKKFSEYGNPIDMASEGIKQAAIGKVMELGGKLGVSTVGGIANKFGQGTTDLLRRSGSALGNAAVNLPVGGVPGMVQGAVMGAVAPSEAWGQKAVSNDVYNNEVLPKAAKETITAFNPLKNAYDYFSNIGKDITEAATTVAKEGIIPGKSQDGQRLDNSDGMEQILNQIAPKSQYVDSLLASDKSNQFDLELLKKQAIDRIQNDPRYKNPSSQIEPIKEVIKQIDTAIDGYTIKGENGQDDTVIKGFGKYTTGNELNGLKKSWWETRYDQNNKVPKEVAGLLGNLAKTAIEQAPSYESLPIKEANAEIGKLYDAYNFLDYTHNNTIKGGRLDNRLASMGGAMIGQAVGKLLPIPGVGEAVGTGVGFASGEKFSKMFNDPTARMQKVINELRSYRIIDPPSKGPLNPEVIMPPAKVPVNNGSAVGYNTPQIGMSPIHSNREANPIVTPATGEGMPVINIGEQPRPIEQGEQVTPVHPKVDEQGQETVPVDKLNKTTKYKKNKQGFETPLQRSALANNKGQGILPSDKSAIAAGIALGIPVVGSGLYALNNMMNNRKKSNDNPKK